MRILVIGLVLACSSLVMAKETRSAGGVTPQEAVDGLMEAVESCEDLGVVVLKKDPESGMYSASMEVDNCSE